jgi:hypothetical protein
MGQKGFFDVDRRLEAISAKGDPLETIKKIVPWEDFRADIEAVTETKPEERRSNAGRRAGRTPENTGQGLVGSAHQRSAQFRIIQVDPKDARGHLEAHSVCQLLHVKRRDR